MIVVFILAAAVAAGAAGVPDLQTREHGVKRVYGIQCIPYLQNEPSGPINFRVADIGKRGVYDPLSADLALLRRIQRYVKSPRLRFTYLRNGRFVVYVATGEPCSDAAPGYFVLNGSCNEYYEPGENPEYTHATPGCLIPPRPWMPSDRARHLRGNPNSWSDPRLWR